MTKGVCGVVKSPGENERSDMIQKVKEKKEQQKMIYAFQKTSTCLLTCTQQ